MTLRDLQYIVSPLQHVVVLDRNYENEDGFNDYDILYSGMWYRMHGVDFSWEVIDMYEAIHDLNHAIVFEVKDVHYNKTTD